MERTTTSAGDGMSKHVRTAILASTFALITTGCGLIGSSSDAKKNDSKDSSDSTAAGSVKDRQFSLSLPELPDDPVKNKYKAHLRIYYGDMPIAMEECSSPGYPGYPDRPTKPTKPERPKKTPKPADLPEDSSPDSEPPMQAPTEPVQEDKKLALYSEKEPYGIVYEDSIPYVPGSTLGPVLLDHGVYTAILDVYGSGDRAYTGHAWFKVGQGIQEIEMKMSRTGDCGGDQGGVVIKPVLPDDNDQVSACEFLEHMKFPPDACMPEKATCYYRNFKGPSHCSVHLAKYGLIKQLCSKDVMVSRTKFFSEVMCESSTLPPSEPPLPPSEPPMPPSKEPRSCQELRNGCDTGKAEYCVAYYYHPLKGDERKAYSGIGDKCTDRRNVLKEMCEQKVEKYDLSCK